MSIPNCLLERELDPLGAEPLLRLAELALLGLGFCQRHLTCSDS